MLFSYPSYIKSAMYIGVKMNNLHKLLCISIMIVMKSFASCIPLCQLSFESLYARLCSGTVAITRKQVTHRLYFVVFNLILIPQFSSDLNESSCTSNASAMQQYLEDTKLMSEVLQKMCDWETRQTLKESISANKCCLQ